MKTSAAVTEILAFFILFFLLIKYLCMTCFSVFQYRILGWDFFAHLMMFVVPCAIILLRRESLRDYGLAKAYFKDPEFKTLAKAAFIVLPLILMVEILVAVLSGSYNLYLNMPLEWFGLWRKWTGFRFYAAGMAITISFEVVFCGFFEEVLFRGYIQGRINNALGRPWKIMGVNIGWGLIISSILFALAHGLGTFNPFGGFSFHTYSFMWREFFITGVQGFIFGILRDRTGGIAAPVLLHAAVCLTFGSIMIGK